MADRAGRVAGRVAIVTGGASGIGEACVRLLASEGARVVLADIDRARGEAVVADVAAAGGTACFAELDVTDEQRWSEVVAETMTAYGGLNILVNNAGIGIGGFCEDMSLADWRRQTAVNLDGVFLGTKHAIPAIRASGSGSIVIVSSGAGLKGTPGMSGYCATKGAVRLFAKAVALELARKGDAIRVNSIHPGLVDTPIWTKVDSATRDVMAAAVASDGRTIDPSILAQAMVPNGAVGQPADIAAAVLFLASDESRYVTGAELAVDGGATAG